MNSQYLKKKLKVTKNIYQFKKYQVFCVLFISGTSN